MQANRTIGLKLFLPLYYNVTFKKINKLVTNL